jgi:hypothetical protein
MTRSRIEGPYSGPVQRGRSRVKLQHHEAAGHANRHQAGALARHFHSPASGQPIT